MWLRNSQLKVLLLQLNNSRKNNQLQEKENFRTKYFQIFEFNF